VLSCVVMAFHLYFVMQNSTNEVYFWIGQEWQMFANAKKLLIFSAITLCTSIFASYKYEAWFGPDELFEFTYINPIGCFVNFIEIAILYSCA